jgi:hypothetical protein
VASAPEDQGIEAGGFQPDSQPAAAIGNGGAVVLWGQGAKVEPGGAGGTRAGQGGCGDHQDRFPGKGMIEILSFVALNTCMSNITLNKQMKDMADGEEMLAKELEGYLENIDKNSR